MSRTSRRSASTRRSFPSGSAAEPAVARTGRVPTGYAARCVPGDERNGPYCEGVDRGRPAWRVGAGETAGTGRGCRYRRRHAAHRAGRHRQDAPGEVPGRRYPRRRRPGGLVALRAGRRTDVPAGDDEWPAVWPDLARTGEVVPVGPLTEPDVGALLAAAVGGPVPDGLAARVARRTGGNAFYVTELARAVAGSGEAGADA